MLKNIVILIVIILLFGCSQEQPVQPMTGSAPATETKTNSSQPDGTEHLLVFFIDPDGGPCRMQGEILATMSAELKGKVLVRPVQTTVKEDIDIFYAYGIRALPTILLADPSGRELKRLPPGVHPAETIRNLLNQIPAN